MHFNYFKKVFTIGFRVNSDVVRQAGMVQEKHICKKDIIHEPSLQDRILNF